MDAFVPEVAPPPLLECRDLTKRYGATVALDRFTVSLPAGRIVGLLGPNGSGKTTLLKMIAGVADPAAGDIRVAGYEVGPESKALVSYLPERTYLNDWMRVEGILEMFSDFYPDFNEAKARDMVDYTFRQLMMQAGMDSIADAGFHCNVCIVEDGASLLIYVLYAG